MSKSKDIKKIRDLKTGEFFQRGKKYIHPIKKQEMIFDSYINSSTYQEGEYKGYYYCFFRLENDWIDRERKRKKRAQKIKEEMKNKNFILKKRLNPLTNEHYRYGDFKIKDGIKYFFIAYRHKYEGIYKSGKKEYFNSEKWVQEKLYLRKRIMGQLTVLRGRAKKKNIPFTIDVDYALSIFPKNKRCPVLDINFEFGFPNKTRGKGSDNFNSPSLDKIIPKKGYVEGNVIWVSRKVNAIKSDSTHEELMMIGNYFKSLENK
jgi:hypothetical protein